MTDVHDRRGVVGARSNCRYHRSVHFLGNNDDVWSKYLKMARTIRFIHDMTLACVASDSVALNIIPIVVR